MNKFPNNSDNAMLNRLEYAKMLIDAITIKLNKINPN